MVYPIYICDTDPYFDFNNKKIPFNRVNRPLNIKPYIAALFKEDRQIEIVQNKKIKRKERLQNFSLSFFTRINGI